MEVRACSDTTRTAEQLEKDLDRLVRYKTCIERTFHRSLKELKALQTNAVIQAILPDSVRQHAGPLSSATEISKRTQHSDQRHERQSKQLANGVSAIEISKRTHQLDRRNGSAGDRISSSASSSNPASPTPNLL